MSLLAAELGNTVAMSVSVLPSASINEILFKVTPVTVTLSSFLSSFLQDIEQIIKLAVSSKEYLNGLIFLLVRFFEMVSGSIVPQSLAAVVFVLKNTFFMCFDF
jgi:hypothetical protein